MNKTNNRTNLEWSHFNENEHRILEEFKKKWDAEQIALKTIGSGKNPYDIIIDLFHDEFGIKETKALVMTCYICKLFGFKY